MTERRSPPIDLHLRFSAELMAELEMSAKFQGRTLQDDVERIVVKELRRRKERPAWVGFSSAEDMARWISVQREIKERLTRNPG